MQRKINNNRLERIWVERIVWNAAAFAALAVMVAILLCSLRWLDQMEVGPNGDFQKAAERARLKFDQQIDARPTQVARVNRPSG